VTFACSMVIVVSAEWAGVGGESPGRFKRLPRELLPNFQRASGLRRKALSSVHTFPIAARGDAGL